MCIRDSQRERTFELLQSVVGFVDLGVVDIQHQEVDQFGIRPVGFGDGHAEERVLCIARRDMYVGEKDDVQRDVYKRQVQDLTAQRHDGLEITVAARFGRAACRVTLDEEDFGDRIF